jgi:small conductance mechanosensitive channel
VCSAQDPAAVLDRFALLPAVVTVLERSDRSAVGLTIEGVPVSLTVATPSAFGTAVIRATGSPDYVAALPGIASELAEGTERDKLRQARRRATVANLLLSTFQIVVWSVVVLLILSSIGVNLGPLLATAGIAGVALGFGAQTIVRDTLSGFFILAENQYDVGDTVELQTTANPVAGTGYKYCWTATATALARVARTSARLPPAESPVTAIRQTPRASSHVASTTSVLLKGISRAW